MSQRSLKDDHRESIEMFKVHWSYQFMECLLKRKKLISNAGLIFSLAQYVHPTRSNLNTCYPITW